MDAENSKVIDLFCGCGGFSLGAARAGFAVIAAVDNDPHALSTHKKNFPHALHLDKDLSRISGSELKEHLAANGGICGVIGGPPCQGFSCIGKRDDKDRRNRLFSHFFRLVNELQPIFFICENVPGILREKYSSTRTFAISHVKDDYEMLPPMSLIASDYGVPTSRARVFFLGFRRDFPMNLSESDFLPQDDVEKITVEKAIKGLPIKINPNWQNEEQGWRTVRSNWNGAFGERLVGRIPHGIGDRKAIEILQKQRKVSGCLGTVHAEEILKRYRNIERGDKDGISKSVRLDPKRFCPTLRAGTGPEKGSYQAVRPIHPTEDRVITPREAARLQGFPDWFQFDPTKWHSFRQIGNSVSPILAEYILSIVYETLKQTSK